MNSSFSPDQPAIPADPQAANDAWVGAVKIANARGYKQRYRKAVTKEDFQLMRDQNRAISRVSFGMPEGYERIQWSTQV